MPPPQTRLPLLGYAIDGFQADGSAITGTYALVGKEVEMENATSIFLHIHYTKGDETSIEIKAEYSTASGGTLSQPTVITTTAGTSVITTLEFQMVGTDNFIIPFGAEGAYVKFYIKATGGTPTGTFGADVYLPRE